MSNDLRWPFVQAGGQDDWWWDGTNWVPTNQQADGWGYEQPQEEWTQGYDQWGQPSYEQGWEGGEQPLPTNQNDPRITGGEEESSTAFKPRLGSEFKDSKKGRLIPLMGFVSGLVVMMMLLAGAGWWFFLTPPDFEGRWINHNATSIVIIVDDQVLAGSRYTQTECTNSSGSWDDKWGCIIDQNHGQVDKSNQQLCRGSGCSPVEMVGDVMFILKTGGLCEALVGNIYLPYKYQDNKSLDDEDLLRYRMIWTQRVDSQVRPMQCIVVRGIDLP